MRSIKQNENLDVKVIANMASQNDKVGILSLYGNYNCGNKLQAYALIKAISEFCGEAVFLRYVDGMPRQLRAFLGEKKRAFRRKSLPRLQCFRRFASTYIPAEVVRSPEKIGHAADFFVLGSDQIWNPDMYLGSRTDGLQCLFSIPSNRKIAYAASFGISLDDMSMEYRELYRKWLGTFAPENISVREREGARIVEELMGYSPQVVLDPTMLLDAQEWKQIERKPRIAAVEKPFCAMYFLGDTVDSALLENAVKTQGLQAVNLVKPSLPIGPREFLWAIRNSEFVVTDSFHATVFSLLFHRPFAVVRREDRKLNDMSTRFDKLRQLFPFEYCSEITGGFPRELFDATKWEEFELRLTEERRTSQAYLTSGLERLIQPV